MKLSKYDVQELNKEQTKTIQGGVCFKWGLCNMWKVLKAFMDADDGSFVKHQEKLNAEFSNTLV